MNSQKGFMDYYNAQIRELNERLQGINPLASQPLVAQPPKLTQQELLCLLYDEFINTEDGKQLAAGFTKFARFIQSKVDKGEA